MTPLVDRPNKRFLLDFEMLKRLFLAAEGDAEIIASWRRLRASYHRVGQYNLCQIIEELRVSMPKKNKLKKLSPFRKRLLRQWVKNWEL